MRRPKRSLVAELEAHRQVAASATGLCTALVAVEPEISEFMVARRFLEDGVKELERRKAAAEAPPPPLAEPEAGR